MDKKTLWALTLSFLILAVWSVIYPRLFPPPPVPPVTDQTAAGMPAGGTGASGAPGAGLAGTPGAASPAAPGSASAPGEEQAAGSIVGGNPEESAPPKLEAPAGTPPVVVETQFARIEIASEGGSIRSWTLNQYHDGKGDPYDLVSPGSRSTGVYPLQISSGLGADYEAADVERATALASVKLGRPTASLQTQIVDEGSRGFLLWGHRPAVIHVLNVADPLEALNKARFVIERGPGSKPGTTELVKLSYSDGAGLEATKTLEFTKDSYFVRVGADVTRLGKPVPARIIWGPGIGTPYGDEPRRYEGAVSVGGTGAVTRMVSHYVPEPRAVAEGSMVWGGAEEQYFAAVFSPASGTMAVEALPAFPPLPPVAQPLSPGPGGSAGAPPEQKIAPPKHLVVLVPTGQSYDLYAGPKDYQLLTGLGRGLPSLVDFSPSTPLIGPLIGILARVLYAGLRFLYGVVGNYGVGIVILTATVKILFYPITQRTMVKMRQVQAQMAKLKPKADAIKNKYKKIKDIAGRNKMNEEIMELYKREGVNPMASLGGCLPLLIQLPILYGFYRVLNVSIELRQAPFFGWIKDLSRSDPYYVTPIVMGASMFMQQRLAMMSNVTDPQQQMQQRMMLLMPLIFTWTFLHLPSGLVLYWFVNNVLGIAQQMLINRQAKALDARAAAQAAGKA